MEINKKVYEKIESNNVSLNMQFSLFCAGRVIDLYKEFDAMIKNENLALLNGTESGYKTLSGAYNFIIQNAIVWEDKDYIIMQKVQEYLNLCDLCMPDDDDYGGFETTIAQLSASTIRYTLSYWITKNKSFPKKSSDSMIDIVNNVFSEQYLIQKGQGGSYAEKRTILQQLYLSEIDFELNSILKIQDGLNPDDLKKMIEENKISINSFYLS